MQVVFRLIVIELKLSVPVVQIGQLFVLQLGFLAEPKVLDHDVSLDFRDVFLSLLNSILPEVIKQLGIVRVNLLLLAFAVLRTLLLHLIVQTEEHLVTVLLILDLSLLHHLGILELSQLLLGLEQCLHLVLSLLLLLVVTFDHVLLLRIEPIHWQPS